MNSRVHLLDLTSDQLRVAAKQRLPSGAGVAADVYRQVMREGRFAPEELDITAASARGWREHFTFELPTAVSEQSEVMAVAGHPDIERTTNKSVLRRSDGLEFECVRIPIGADRSSLCVSSQVGCRMGCKFCETGRMGWLGDLSAADIVGQVVWTRTRSQTDSRSRLPAESLSRLPAESRSRSPADSRSRSPAESRSRSPAESRAQSRSRGATGGAVANTIVFMGMGEALDNADALVQALHVLCDPVGLGYAHDKLTVCTVGHVDGIRRLAATPFKRLNLSLSLNAANDELRDSFMPINRRWPLVELQRALIDFRRRPNFQLGVNYCLMPGINDRREHAVQVAQFCAPLGRSMVYVIPYNPGTHPIAAAPSREQVDTFIAWLREAGLSVRRRITKGRDVMAACGQLGNLQLRRSRR